MTYSRWPIKSLERYKRRQILLLTSEASMWGGPKAVSRQWTVLGASEEWKWGVSRIASGKWSLPTAGMLWRISKSQSQRQSLQPTSWFVMALKEELTSAEPGPDSWAMETMRWGVSVALKHHVVIHFGIIINSLISVIVLRIPSVPFSPWLFPSL
jgi:hypothetical protein